MMAQHESDSIIMFSWLTRNKPNYDLLITIIIRDDERERGKKRRAKKTSPNKWFHTESTRNEKDE